jgi:hypothetical protein
MLTVASTAAVGFLVASWAIKYGVGIAYCFTGSSKTNASTHFIDTFNRRQVGSAILEILKLAFVVLVWNYDSVDSGPASIAALVSIASLVEFTSMQQQDVFCASSSVAAFYIGARDTSGSSHPLLPSVLIFVSVLSLVWQRYYLTH